jgi:O-antigen ligase
LPATDGSAPTLAGAAVMGEDAPHAPAAAHKRLRLWLWALPMFLLASGPPMLRDDWRDPLATLRGALDVWALWQAAVYLFAGALALLLLLRPLREGVHRRQLPLILLSTLMVALFCASSLWSPAIAATFAMGALLGIALLVTAQFAHNGAQLRADAIRLLEILLWLAGGLAAAVLVAYLLDVRSVTVWSPSGVRVRGGRLGTQTILGPVIFVISLYFLAMRLRPAAPMLAWVAFGTVVIWLARTRATYIIALFGALLVWLLWIREISGRRRWMLKAAISLTVGSAVVGAALVSSGAIERQWLRGGSTDSLTTLSHRTTIWAWTFERIAERPMGFGYSTGFRQMFLTMDPIARDAYRYEGLAVERIGEAHNAFIEMFVAAGFPGLLLCLSLLGTVLYRGANVALLERECAPWRHAARLALILLLMCLLDAMTKSAYALPGRQSFGILLFLAGMLVMLDCQRSARNRRGWIEAATPRSSRPVLGSAADQR